MLTGERLQAYLRARDQGAIDRVRWTLLENSGNVAAAARSLDVSERCLWRWIDRLELAGHVEASRHRDSDVIANAREKSSIRKNHDTAVIAKRRKNPRSQKTTT